MNLKGITANYIGIILQISVDYGLQGTTTKLMVFGLYTTYV